MTTSAIESQGALIRDIHLTEDTLTVDLVDGRSLSVPLAWFPRLTAATPEERANFRLIGGGSGIHWPQIDEDISTANLLAGIGSGESHESLQRWLISRHPSK